MLRIRDIAMGGELEEVMPKLEVRYELTGPSHRLEASEYWC